MSRAVEGSLSSFKAEKSKADAVLRETAGDFDVTETIKELEGSMVEAANNLEFEKAALFRDQINELKRAYGGAAPGGSTTYPSPKKSRGGRKKGSS